MINKKSEKALKEECISLKIAGKLKVKNKNKKISVHSCCSFNNDNWPFLNLNEEGEEED